MIAMNTIAPHVKEGTELSLEQFLIKYGEQPVQELELLEPEQLGSGEYYLDASFFGAGPGSQYAGTYVERGQQL